MATGTLNQIFDAVCSLTSRLHVLAADCPRAVPAYSMAAGLLRAGWLSVAFLLICSGCGETEQAGTNQSEKNTVQIEDTSHRQMVDLLRNVAVDALATNEYFQTVSVDSALSQLQSEQSPGARFQLHLGLMDDFRRLGRNSEAVEHLNAALKLIEDRSVVLTAEQRDVFLYQAGVTFLRLGETENCVHCRTSQSCIIPIAETGIHQQKTGSQTASLFFRKVLESNPDHAAALWLLNISSMTLGEYPKGISDTHQIDPGQFEDEGSFPIFQDVATSAGIRSVNCGGGAVADDFDGDGDFDLLTSTWDPSGPMHYFENDGAGVFKDRTKQSGLTGITGGINMVQADFDNDGDVDVFVVRGAWLGRSGRYPNSLLRNDGHGHFEDVSFSLGFGPPFYPSSSASWFDFDNDGDLDLYVGNEHAPCQLFRNDGTSGFLDIAGEAGVTNDRYAKGVITGDLNGDDLPDIYVSNLAGDNRLYVNSGDNTFIDRAVETGIHKPGNSFPVWIWDLNNDGHDDLFVASYEADVANIARDHLDDEQHSPADCLFLGTGDGRFTDAAAEFGLTGSSQPMGCNFGDLDNDGYLDFYLGTGYPEYEALMPNLMFRNVKGQRFESVTYAGRFGHLQKGHGVAFCDFDSDGDQDVFIQTGGAYPGDAFGDVLFENPGFDNNWISVRVVGRQSNRSGIGARIMVALKTPTGERRIYRRVNSGGSFGANPLQQHIGIGAAERIERVEVFWPATGNVQVIDQPDINSVLTVTESDQVSGSAR